MIVCPNCNHHNPEGASQCEACYTPLPEMIACPSCEALVQSDANFCGQCGYDLKENEGLPPTALEAGFAGVAPPILGLGRAELGRAEFGKAEPDRAEFGKAEPGRADLGKAEPGRADLGKMGMAAAQGPEVESSSSRLGSAFDTGDLSPPDGGIPASQGASSQGTADASPMTTDIGPFLGATPTQLQSVAARLLHVRSNVLIDLPVGLSVIHIGKTNERVPPDIDLSGFQDSEIVSRVHADIRIEGDAYYLEDMGSANGTFVNNLPLPRGNRHRLRGGDRLSFGKGDLVTFLFQLG
jgi:ribosomal protein L40E